MHDRVREGYLRTQLELIPDSLVFMVTEVDVSVVYLLVLGVLYIFILLHTISHLIETLVISTFLAFKLPAEFVESLLVDWRQLLLVVLLWWCLLLVGDLWYLTRSRMTRTRFVHLLLLLFLLTSISVSLIGEESIHFL